MKQAGLAIGFWITVCVSAVHSTNDTVRCSHLGESLSKGDVIIQGNTQCRCDDGGAVVCEASTSAQLQVTPETSRVLRKHGGSVVFACSSPDLGHGNDPHLTWVAPTKQVIRTGNPRMYTEKDSAHDLKLYIEVIEPEDEGFYSCKAHIGGHLVELRIQLLLFKEISFPVAPTIQQPVPGSDAVIACQAESVPEPVITWRRGHGLIENGGRYSYLPEGLLIKNVTEADNGQYICVAEVAERGDMESVDIQVQVQT